MTRKPQKLFSVVLLLLVAIGLVSFLASAPQATSAQAIQGINRKIALSTSSLRTTTINSDGSRHQASLVRNFDQTTTTQTPSSSSSIVISQVYGGGGTTGATLNTNFIELFNRGTTTVDLNQWAIRITTANGTPIAGSIFVSSSSINLFPGQYALVAVGTPTANGQPFNADFSIPNPATVGTSGQIILMKPNANVPSGVPCPLPNSGRRSQRGVSRCGISCMPTPAAISAISTTRMFPSEMKLSTGSVPGNARRILAIPRSN